MISDVVQHIAAMTNAKNMDELWELHTNRMAEFGFDRLVYAYARYMTATSIGDPQDWVVMTNHDPDYVDAFIGDGYYLNAPMVRWAVENDGACSWSHMAKMLEMGNLTEAEGRVFKHNALHGVIAGYTISFRSVSARSKGAIALTARLGLSQDDIDAVWAEHGDNILTFNNVMHLKLLTLPYTGARRLTKRQREVLQWVGDGKTTQDIAVLLDLTAATVEKHLRLAREALAVETTAQAVLKAASFNQMFTIDV